MCKTSGFRGYEANTKFKNAEFAKTNLKTMYFFARLLMVAGGNPLQSLCTGDLLITHLSPGGMGKLDSREWIKLDS